MRAPFLPKSNKPKQMTIIANTFKELNKAVEEFEHDILLLRVYVGDQYEAYIEYK